MLSSSKQISCLKGSARQTSRCRQPLKATEGGDPINCSCAALTISWRERISWLIRSSISLPPPMLSQKISRDHWAGYQSRHLPSQQQTVRSTPAPPIRMNQASLMRVTAMPRFSGALNNQYLLNTSKTKARSLNLRKSKHRSRNRQKQWTQPTTILGAPMNAEARAGGSREAPPPSLGKDRSKTARQWGNYSIVTCEICRARGARWPRRWRRSKNSCRANRRLFLIKSRLSISNTLRATATRRTAAGNSCAMMKKKAQSWMHLGFWTRVRGASWRSLCQKRIEKPGRRRRTSFISMICPRKWRAFFSTALRNCVNIQKCRGIWYLHKLSALNRTRNRAAPTATYSRHSNSREWITSSQKESLGKSSDFVAEFAACTWPSVNRQHSRPERKGIWLTIYAKITGEESIRT